MTFVEVTIRSLPHLLLGAAVFYAVIGREDDSLQRKSALFLLGALLGLSPDFTKAFGDIALHSLLSVPVVAPLYALLLRLLVLNEGLPRLTAAAAAAIVFGHLLVDAAGNGNALLYPLTDYEFSLWLLNRHEAALSLVFGAFVEEGQNHRGGDGWGHAALGHERSRNAGNEINLLND